MFSGAYNISTYWYVTYVKNGVTYYLSKVDESSANVVWSKRKENGKKFNTSSEADNCVEQIRLIRNNKKLDLKTKQA